jgi:hypothetical protein
MPPLHPERIELPATAILKVRHPPSLISNGEVQLFCALRKGTVNKDKNHMKRLLFSSGQFKQRYNFAINHAAMAGLVYFNNRT